MPYRRACFAVSAFVVLSGCIGPGTLDEARDGPTNTRLLASSGSVMHRGSGSVDAVPEHAVPMPDHCVLYRNNVSHKADSCEIKEGPPKYPRDLEAPWHVDAKWEGSDSQNTMERFHEKNVTAFDSNGREVAWWDGTATHPEFSMAIE